MIDEIIWYNLSCFAAIVMSGISGGIVWEWNRKIGLAIFMIFTVVFVGSFVGIVASVGDAGSSDAAFSTMRQWYYFIGSFCGGIIWTPMFRVGRDVYRNTMSE